MGQTSSNGFDQRKKAFEAKYIHDAELTFRIQAKCHHLFGLWAATQLGYESEKKDKYIETIIIFEFQKSHNETVLDKVLRDFQEAQLEVSLHRLHREFERCWEEAKVLIMKEKETP